MRAEEFQRRLDALGADYRDRLPGKVAEIARLWRDASSGIAPQGCLAELKRELHTLAGSAKTFGVTRASELAAAAEALLDACCEPETLPDAAAAAELTRLLEALQRSTGDA